MNYKSVLLGTAAVFAVAGSARAADLAVAESVEYVKVCDAYGTGYFYIPGSDTCLKIGGDVIFWAFGGGDAYAGKSAGGIVKGFTPGTFAAATAHTNTLGAATINSGPQDWWYRTRADISVDAKSMTDWGVLDAFVNMRSNNALGGANANGASSNNFYAQTAWARIGGLKVGWDESVFDFAVFQGKDGEFPTSFDHDRNQGQVVWSTNVGGFGFFLSAEDPNNNGGAAGASPFSSQPPVPGYNVSGPGPGGIGAGWAGNWPDLVAAVTGKVGDWNWKWSGAATDTTVGTGWGSELGAQWLSHGNSVTLQGAVSNGAGAAYGANIIPDGYGSGTYWHAAGQVGFAVTQAFTILFEGGYQATPGPTAWEADVEADWTVGKGAVFAVEYYYLSKNLSGNILPAANSVNFMFSRSFD